jgi:hypothetical protein
VKKKKKEISLRIFQQRFLRIQPFKIFFFDKKNGRLLQHNYTADIISKWAKAAHVVVQHDENRGIVFPSRRIVSPRTFAGKAMKATILIDITVHSFIIK